MKAIPLVIFLSYLFSCTPSFADLHQWKVIRVIDGDTIEVEAPFLPKELKLFVRNGTNLAVECLRMLELKKII